MVKTWLVGLGQGGPVAEAGVGGFTCKPRRKASRRNRSGRSMVSSASLM